MISPKRFEVFDDVSFQIKQLIHRGKRLLEQVKQGAIAAINIEAQLVLIALGTSGFFDRFTISETKNFKDDVCNVIRSNSSLININAYKELNVASWNDKVLKVFSK